MEADAQAMHKEIAAALRVLERGGTILYPTDTVWGIGCDATNEAAVRKIFGIKERSESKSLIVLVDGFAMLAQYVGAVADKAKEYIAMSDRPLTIIYPEGKKLAKSVVHKDGSVAIRITKDAFSAELIRQFGRPIVSTSANISGEPTPGNFSAIDPLICARVDHVVALRQDEKKEGIPSTILAIGIDGAITVIRE